MAEPDLDAGVVALPAQVRLTCIDAGDEGVAKAGGIAEGITHVILQDVTPLYFFLYAGIRISRVAY